MTRIVCHADVGNVPINQGAHEIHVVLYGTGAMSPGVARIGAPILDPISRFGSVLRTDAFDFLSIALAVTAADTFVLRSEAEDRWSRNLELVVPLIAPEPWIAVRERLEKALRFLSGDRWTFSFERGGPHPPGRGVVKRRRRAIDLSQAECACLFSGGLDSYAGVLDLEAAGRRPVLVSHAYPKDRQYQNDIARHLPVVFPRFSANAHPTRTGATDVSMRTRSFNFLAYGAVAATAISQFRGGPVVDLFVPENGHIALNPPLTPRRIGAQSTRTTHPYFLDTIQDIMRDVGLPVALVNPLRHETKGEILARHATNPAFAVAASRTVSCGKWKRANEQCGRCVPCLIRRAAFHAAALPDYTRYTSPHLDQVMGDASKRDDVASVMTAVRRARKVKVEPWVVQAGPLPHDARERAECVDVFRRGILELDSFLRTHGLP